MIINIKKLNKSRNDADIFVNDVYFGSVSFASTPFSDDDFEVRFLLENTMNSFNIISLDKFIAKEESCKFLFKNILQSVKYADDVRLKDIVLEKSFIIDTLNYMINAFLENQLIYHIFFEDKHTLLVNYNDNFLNYTIMGINGDNVEQLVTIYYTYVDINGRISYSSLSMVHEREDVFDDFFLVTYDKLSKINQMIYIDMFSEGKLNHLYAKSIVDVFEKEYLKSL